MTRRLTTSFNHKQTKQNLCYDLQLDSNNPTVSNGYNEMHGSLINKNCHYDNPHQNAHLSNHHLIPPPYRNNLKPVDSPLRRPRSPTEDAISELEDFEQDPSKKFINNNRKKTKYYKEQLSSNFK